MMPKSRLRKISSRSSMQNGDQETTVDPKKDIKAKSELRKRKWFVMSVTDRLPLSSKRSLYMVGGPWDMSGAELNTGRLGDSISKCFDKRTKQLSSLHQNTQTQLVRWPPFIDITNPQEFGIRGARNFYLDVEENITIGVWHILPQSYLTSEIKEDQFEDLLKSGKPIFLYLHGNSGTRAGWHRVQLNKLIASMDYHVISIDYRGYGDSKGIPTEEGVVTDSYHIYKWIKERHGSSPVFLWGHSLGTAITTKLAKKLCELDEKPEGVILESPFNNIRDAAKGHPLSLPFRFLPWFQWVFVDTIKLSNIYFSSDENIGSVTTPLLIMHAKDDDIVPYDLGEKLYDAALKTRPKESGPVEFISFNASFRYGHKHIFKAPELPSIIRYQSMELIEFLEECTVLDPRFKNFFSKEKTYAIHHRLRTACVAISAIKTEPGLKATSAKASCKPNTPALPTLPGLEVETGAIADSQTEPDADLEIATLVQPEPATTSDSTDRGCTGLASILSDVIVVRTDVGQKSTIDRAYSELDHYKDQSQISLNSNPLEWWKENAIYYPLLSNVAKVRLCIPATSVPSELVFSTAGDIISAKRAALHPEMLDKLLFLKKNMHLALLK